MNQTALELMADAILARLINTAPGHCARVDYFERQQAIALCETMKQSAQERNIAFYILAPATQNFADPRYISTDQAIEIRNRKRQRLCLFVPSDLVDAAFSSLSNSFAPIDGGTIYREVIKTIYDGLSTAAQYMVRAIQRTVKPPLRLSLNRQLTFYAKVAEHDSNQALDRVGLDLCDVGLLSDNGADWMNRLDRNRTATIKLALPLRIQASTVERVDSLGIDAKTRTELIKFLHGKPVNDVSTWSASLYKYPDITLDRWQFPQEDSSDLVSVSIVSFVNAQGVVEKSSNLKQPDGPGGLLYASFGAKESMTVRWKCEPPKPHHLVRWRVEIMPTHGYTLDEDTELDLPSRDISASRRSLKLSLDIDIAPEDIPDYPLCIRVTPLDKSGNPVRLGAEDTPEHSDQIIATSEEFYLSNEPTPPPPITLTSTRRTTPTIAFGRIEALLDSKAGQGLLEREPQWNVTHTNFSLRVSDRRLINLSLSSVLAEIERRSIARPGEAQRYIVAPKQITSLISDDVVTEGIENRGGDGWARWMKERKNFFDALVRQKPRDVAAAADWKDLAEAARRYGDAYQLLLTELIEQRAVTALREILCVDTIHVRVQGQRGLEESLVVLPIHPLRATWIASYTQLLRHWEERLSQAAPKDRKLLIDLDLLRALEPANVPPFLYHPKRPEAVLSAGNLGFFYGVYTAAPFSNMEGRLADLGQMFAIQQVGSLATNDILTTQLARHLKTFQELHPYVDVLSLALVQTENSAWVSDALLTLATDSPDDENNDTPSLPALSMTAYVEHPEHVTAISGIERVRQIFSDRGARRESDHLHPLVSSAIAPLSTIGRADTDEAHVAIIGDLATAAIGLSAATTSASGMQSLSVYGLIARLIPVFTLVQNKLQWTNMLALPDSLPQEHPGAPRYGKTLLDLYRVTQRAGGIILGNNPDSWPAITYTIEPHQEQMIKDVHSHAHWVVTTDRFFALDYYDSPHEPALQQQSQTYLLDYAPEFVDGIGQRMFITTRWRGEIESLLATAMEELGFHHIDRSVGHVLNYLKTVSGQLALQLTRSDTSAAAAVGMGIVTAYLKQRGELEQAILIPIDSAPRLVSRTFAEGIKKGERRCDMLLLSLKRNIIDATFIEVKWRRGTSSFDSLASEMDAQMRTTAESVRTRYFSVDRTGKDAVDERADGVLQRAYFANVVVFYINRAYRYGLITSDVYKTLTDHLRGIERPTYEFRPKCRGFIVTLEKGPTSTMLVGDTVIDIITASDLAAFPSQTSESIGSDSELHINMPIVSTSSGTFAPIQASIVDSNVTPPEVTSQSVSVEAHQLGSPHENSLPPIHVGPESIAETTDDSSSPPVNPSAVQHPAEEVEITLGESARGPVVWKPSVRGSPHLFIIGIPGQGKSVTTNHILVEMARQHVPALVLDFHGQFGDPMSVFARTSGSQVVNAAQGLPFSPFEVMVQNGKSDWKQNSVALADIFAYVVGLGGMQKDLIQNAIQDAYKAHGYANDTLEIRTLPTVEEVLKNIEQREQKQKVRNVAARCRPLFELDLFNPVENAISLMDQIKQGLVIDLHDLMSETLQLAAGAFVLRKLYRNMFTWGQASNLRLAIVLDEAHRLAKDVTLPKLMKEGRKYGIAVIVASQGLSDFHTDVLGTAGTKIIFRMNYPESKKIAPYVQPRNPQEVMAQIEQLTVGTALIQTPDMQKGIVAHMQSSEL